jgi:hypothetical protein
MSQSTTPLGLLVSSTRSEAKVWDRLLPLLTAQEEVTQTVELQHVNARQQAGSRVSLSRFRRTFPTTDILADELIAALENEPNRYFVLVGYKSGCNLIQRALLDELEEKKRTDVVARARRVILLSPPQVNLMRVAFILTVGFLIAGGVLQVLAQALGFNSRLLGAIALGLPAIAAILLAIAQFRDWKTTGRARGGSEEFRERIVHGAKQRSGSWPIPVQVEHVLDLSRAVKRDVQQIVGRLLEPLGHESVYDVRLEEVIEILSPLDASQIPPDLRDKIKTDHQTTWSRAVEFQRFNATRQPAVNPWELQLSTSGIIASVTPPNEKNEWTSNEQWDYQTNRKKYLFRFSPRAGIRYELKLRVFGAHGPNNRDAHSHLRADANYETHRRTLDLRPMLAAGYRFAENCEPRAWYVPGTLPVAEGERVLDNGRCGILHEISASARRVDLENKSATPGLYVWELHDVRNGGILAYEYDWATDKGSQRMSSVAN